MLSQFYVRSLPVVLAVVLLCGCNAYQPTKNVWKTTKGLWNTYVSPPASVDYEDKGTLPPQALALSTSMLGIDVELGKLERVMQNADKPPTREWLTNFFATFPWISGFAGVKYDGTMLGQEPADSLKKLDFIPLLYEDKKQNSRALRADVQPSPLGPEVMLAAPIYDGIDFLGIVVAYFDMRALMRYSDHPQDMVVLCPTALLWPGKYDFAATPLAGVNWSEVVANSTAGTCSNATGSFFYMVRYLGNLPLIFAVVEKGEFPEGNGDVQQGAQFFPQERQKLPPPPMPERAAKAADAENKTPAFGASAEAAEPVQEAPGMEAAPTVAGSTHPADGGRSPNEIQPGSRDSVLLKRKASQRQHVQERALEGENVQIERVQRPRRPAAKPAPRRSEPTLDLIPDADMPSLPGGRPSPFGPREAKPSTPDGGAQGADAATPSTPDAGTATGAPSSPSGDATTARQEQKAAPASEAQNGEASEKAAEPASGAAPTAPEAGGPDDGSDRQPALLPGGRPSPFGPRN